ncbi:MAG: alanine racemase [Nitrospirae bacterium]|nr:MAG: alanine racemase [Nitrospirota bacterium]
MFRGISAEINLEALACNLKTVRKLCGDTAVIAVVKADGYGHGAPEVSKKLVECGTGCLAVAFSDEGKNLRESGITAPILVLFDPDPDDIFEYGLTPAVSDIKAAKTLSDEAVKRAVRLALHIKVDTGMGRLGLTGNAENTILEIAGLKNISIEGVMSHFSEADLSDASFARMQIEKFAGLKSGLSGKGLEIKTYHLANSAAVLNLPGSYFDAVRPGLMLYGYAPVKNTSSQKTELTPVMTVKAKLLALRKLAAGTPISYGRTFTTKRESLIGVMSAGYADGFSRRFSNNAQALVQGRRVPVVGRVCMDLTMLDLTDCRDAREGDEVVLLGKQGAGSIDACESALWADTIPYEILTSFGRSARRVYTNG